MKSPSGLTLLNTFCSKQSELVAVVILYVCRNGWRLHVTRKVTRVETVTVMMPSWDRADSSSGFLRAARTPDILSHERRSPSIRVRSKKRKEEEGEDEGKALWDDERKKKDSDGMDDDPIPRPPISHSAPSSSLPRPWLSVITHHLLPEPCCCCCRCFFSLRFHRQTGRIDFYLIFRLFFRKKKNIYFGDITPK